MFGGGVLNYLIGPIKLIRRSVEKTLRVRSRGLGPRGGSRAQWRTRAQQLLFGTVATAWRLCAPLLCLFSATVLFILRRRPARAAIRRVRTTLRPARGLARAHARTPTAVDNNPFASLCPVASYCASRQFALWRHRIVSQSSGYRHWILLRQRVVAGGRHLAEMSY